MKIVRTTQDVEIPGTDYILRSGSTVVITITKQDMVDEGCAPSIIPDGYCVGVIYVSVNEDPLPSGLRIILVEGQYEPVSD